MSGARRHANLQPTPMAREKKCVLENGQIFSLLVTVLPDCLKLHMENKIGKENLSLICVVITAISSVYNAVGTVPN